MLCLYPVIIPTGVSANPTREGCPCLAAPSLHGRVFDDLLGSPRSRPNYLQFEPIAAR